MVSNVSVCWLDCRQDYTKTMRQISTRLVWRMALGPVSTPSSFGADLDRGTDTGHLFLTLFNIAI